MLSLLIPRRQPAGKVRCGLLNTGELCVIDVHGNVQTYTVDSTRTIREALAGQPLPGDEATVHQVGASLPACDTPLPTITG